MNARPSRVSRDRWSIWEYSSISFVESHTNEDGSGNDWIILGAILVRDTYEDVMTAHSVNFFVPIILVSGTLADYGFT